jgi:hypothetical protein
MNYEDTGGFGGDEFDNFIPSGITSLPFQQPIAQPIVQPIQPTAQPVVQPVAPEQVVQPIVQPAIQESTQPIVQPVQPIEPVSPAPVIEQQAVEPAGVFGLPSLAQQQAIAQQTPQPTPQPVQPTGPSPETINALSQQILGQGLSSKWSGEGFGSAEKNAEDMAKILAGIGITDIKEFGKITKTIPGYSYETEQGTVNVPEQTVTTYGNKVTGQEVPNTYSERQTGNFFGGTFSGKGNTGYGVQFDSQGNPIFYTQGASSNDLANIMKDLGPLGQIAIAAATGGLSLPAQLAANAGIQLLAGGNLGDIVKGTALSYLGGQAGNLISGSSGITDLLGKTGSDIAAKTAQQFVGSGGKADLGQALLGNVVGSGVNSAIGDIPGLEDLSKSDRNMASNLISAVATGTPIEQAIQNALVGKASSVASGAIAEARNAEPAPQTYEEMMSGIEPKMSSPATPDVGPSNDEILNQIGYEKPASEEDLTSQKVLNLLSAGGDESDITNLLSQTGPTVDYGKQDLSKSELDSQNLMNLISAGGQDTSTTETSTQATDNLINKAVTDTLGTKTETAAEPATGKDKAMDDIDYSQIFGDYGINIADEIANAGTSGNASSLFSGDGGIDLSALSSSINDDGTTGNIQDTINSLTSDKNNQGYYDEITGEFVQNPLGGLLNPLDDSQGDNSQGYYNELTGEFVQNKLGGLSNPLGADVGNLDPNSKWEYSQTKPNVWTNDKGEEIDLSYLPNTQKTMTGAEIMKKAGATAGSGAKASTTKAAAKPGTSPGTNNTGMIMALMAMMAMMNNKGGGGSSGATIPSLQANRSQLPYAPVGGAPAARPGAGGVNYFSPTTYTAKAAEGGLMGLAGGGMSNLGGYSDGGRLLRGPGDGVSDSIPATIGGKQPARLATGEFVVPARIVSELGNGDTKSGADKLYGMMDRVQKARRKTKNVAADTKAHKYLPA